MFPDSMERTELVSLLGESWRWFCEQWAEGNLVTRDWSHGPTLQSFPEMDLFAAYLVREHAPLANPGLRFIKNTLSFT